MFWFEGFHVGLVAKTEVLEGSRHACEHVARVVFSDRPSYHELILINACAPHGSISQGWGPEPCLNPTSPLGVGGLARLLLYLPFFPFGEGVITAPY